MADAQQAVRILPGTVVTLGAGLGVNTDGGVYQASFWDGKYVPALGDSVMVIVADGVVWVQGPYVTGQRFSTGTVAGSPVSGLLPVTVGSTTISARYVGTAPGVGSLVLLSWEASIPAVVGTAAAYTPPTAPPPPAPAPPPARSSGTLTVTAVDSGTYTNTWWSRDVRQGTYSGQGYQGAWFYGSAPGQLLGATITGFRILLAPRLHIGNYNSSITAHVYRVVQGSKVGVPSYADGPNDFTLVPNAGGQWVSLPASVGQNLVNAGGGGMGLTGSGYGGVAGIDSYPQSGQLQLDWSR